MLGKNSKKNDYRTGYRDGFRVGGGLKKVKNPFALAPPSREDPFRNRDMRYFWLRAEVHVFGQLRSGVHPVIMRQRAEESIRVGDNGVLYQQSIVRVIRNLDGAGRFSGLPTIEGLHISTQRRSSLARDLRSRFVSLDDFTRYARDAEIQQRIAQSRALDHILQRQLHEMQQREWEESERRFEETEAALRQQSGRLRPNPSKLDHEPQHGHDSRARMSQSNRDDDLDWQTQASFGGPPVYPIPGRAMPKGYYGAPDPRQRFKFGESATRMYETERGRRMENHPRAAMGRKDTLPSGVDQKYNSARAATRSHPTSYPTKPHGYAQTRNRVHYYDPVAVSFASKSAGNGPPSAPQGATQAVSPHQGNRVQASFVSSNHVSARRNQVQLNHSTTAQPSRSMNRDRPPVTSRGFDKVWSHDPAYHYSENRERSASLERHGRRRSLSHAGNEVRDRGRSASVSSRFTSMLRDRAPSLSSYTRQSEDTFVYTDRNAQLGDGGGAFMCGGVLSDRGWDDWGTNRLDGRRS